MVTKVPAPLNDVSQGAFFIYGGQIELKNNKTGLSH